MALAPSAMHNTRVPSRRNQTGASGTLASIAIKLLADETRPNPTRRRGMVCDLLGQSQHNRNSADMVNMKNFLLFMLAATTAGFGSACSAALSPDVASQSFIQSGAGVRARTFLDKGRDSVSIFDFQGVVCDGVNDDTAGLQRALTHVLTTGVRLTGGAGGRTCKVTAPLTLVRTSPRHATRLVLDLDVTFNASAVTAGSVLKVGADSQSHFAEAGSIVIRGLKITGNEPVGRAVDPRSLSPLGSTVLLELDYAGNVTLESLYLGQAHTCLKSRFVFPLIAHQVFTNNCFYGRRLQDASNTQVWHGYNSTTTRYATFINPNSGLGLVVNDITDINPRVEACINAYELDTSASAGEWVRGFHVKGGYFAGMTTDLVRVGRAHNLMTPTVRGADRVGEAMGIYFEGGHWSYSRSPILAPFVFSTNGSVRNVHLNTPTPVAHIVGTINSGQVFTGKSPNYPSEVPTFRRYGEYSGGEKAETWTIDATYRSHFSGSYTTTSSGGAAVRVSGTVTGAPNGQILGSYLSNDFTATGTAPLVAQTYIAAPGLTGAVRDAYGLYIAGAPRGATNNFSAFIGGGRLRMGGGTEPGCSAATRGLIVFVEGGPGVADTLRICTKDATNTYAYRQLY
jgi:hypothetical protein